MARDPKIEVAAVSLRIPDPERRDYAGLIGLLADLKTGIKVFGDSHLTIRFFDAESRTGLFAKYTEIDLDGDWFDTQKFDEATPDLVEQIRIPEHLKPNLDQFLFYIDPAVHILTFSKYEDSKALSTRAVSKYFTEILTHPAVMERFGRVESDVVLSFQEVDELLSQPGLKELTISIKMPNPDGIDDNFAEVIRERLRRQKADEYIEGLRSRDGDSLEPDEQSRALAKVAAENGDVVTKAYVNGVLMERRASESPLVLADRYPPTQSAIIKFRELSQEIIGRIQRARRDAQEAVRQT